MRFRQLLLAAIMTTLASLTFAVQGDLDTTFNDSGNLLTGLGQGEAPVPSNMLAIQPNGKIIALSAAGDPSFGDSLIGLTRLNAAGTFDQTFGTGGKSILSVPGWGRSVDMTLQPDGKILIAGRTNADTRANCSAVRLNTDGSVDTSFNGTGVVIADVAPYWCLATSVAVQPDGKVIIAGYLSASRYGGSVGWATARYNSDGTPDTTYGPNGISTTDISFDGKYQGARKVLIQADGGILVCGSVSVPFTFAFGVARFSAGGGLDTAFATNGVATLSQGLLLGTSDAQLQPDGKVVLVGNRGHDIILTRMNPNGSTDSAFGSSGYAVLPEATNATRNGEAVAIQPDGKILAGGVRIINSHADFAVGRFSADGTLEQFRPAGKTLVATGSRKENVPEPLWGNSGVAVGGNSYSEETLWSMAVDAAGRVLVSGNSFINLGPGISRSELSLTRFLSESAPTANIYGTIRTAGGMPIKNVSVVLSEGGLSQPVYALTNQFGLYSFPGLQVTERYSISISSKRFNFIVDQKVITLLHDEESVDFTAEP